MTALATEARLKAKLRGAQSRRGVKLPHKIAGSTGRPRNALIPVMNASFLSPTTIWPAPATSNTLAWGISCFICAIPPSRSEEHTSELQSLMRISYAVFGLKKKKKKTNNVTTQKRQTYHTL